MNLDQGERRKRLDKMVFLNPSNNRWTCHICNVSFTQKVTATNHIEAQHLRILADFFGNFWRYLPTSVRFGPISRNLPN